MNVELVRGGYELPADRPVVFGDMPPGVISEGLDNFQDEVKERGL